MVFSLLYYKRESKRYCRKDSGNIDIINIILERRWYYGKTIWKLFASLFVG